MISDIRIVEGKTRNLDGFVHFVTRETALFRDEPWCRYLVDKGLNEFIIIPEGNVNHFYASPDFQKVLERMSEGMMADWKTHLPEYIRMSTDLLKATEKLSAASQRKDRHKTLKAFRDFEKAIYEFCRYIWTPWIVIYVIEPEVLSKFPEGMDTITSLPRKINYMLMEDEMKSMDNKELAEKYGWLGVYSPCDVPFDEGDFERIRKEKGNEKSADISNNERRFREFIKTVKDKEMRKKVEAVHLYSWLKTDRIDIWKKTMYISIPFFDYLASLTDRLGRKNTPWLTFHEMRELLEGNKAFDEDDIIKRSMFECSFLFAKGKIEMIKGKREAAAMLNTIDMHDKAGVAHGIVASKGVNVRGKAKIILSSSEIGKVCKGDIFISSYTFPTYTPAMLKAAAIVTDEGGLTGHAAVVARENDIPCIIGTKIATKVFKDGDMVEVDTDKGIVRRIK